MSIKATNNRFAIKVYPKGCLLKNTNERLIFLEQTFYAHFCYGTLVNSDYLLPFFIRSIFLELMDEKKDSGAQEQQEGTTIEKILMDLVAEAFLPENQDTLDALNLSLDDFTGRVLARTLPNDFYDISRLEELEKNPTLEHDNYIAGTFEILSELLPGEFQESDSPLPNTVERLSGIDTTYIIPLKHQPSVFENGKGYQDGDKIIDEAHCSIAALGVEIPEDYPLWLCIGVLSAVGWKGECWHKLRLKI